MWEQGVKFLMQLISRIFLELCLLRNQILFFLKLIDVDDLADSQAEARLKKYMTIAGSDSCQVIVFQSNSITFKAAFHLCICDLWSIDYWSCSLFSQHKLQTQTLKKIFLHSEMEINGQNSDNQAEDVSDDFILADTYWVIPWECLV